MLRSTINSNEKVDFANFRPEKKLNKKLAVYIYKNIKQ